MQLLIKYTGFLIKIHGFALIFSFLFVGATPQLSKVFAQDNSNMNEVLRAPREPVAIAGEYLVQFKTDKPLININKGDNPSWLSKLGKDVKINTSLSQFKIAHIQVSNPASSGQWENLANILSSEPSIQHVEPNYVVYPMSMPNDPKVQDMWFLNNISAFKAWDVPVAAGGGDDVVVAVVDTGVQFDHEDLRGHIWINKKEIRDNNIDDDKNGYIDDIVGWNFHSANNFPYAQLNAVPINKDCDIHPTKKRYEYHGTHVAGSIAAVGDNAKGIIGIAKNVKIMPIKALGGPCGWGDIMTIINAIAYAAKNGADIINLSIGSTAPSKIAQSLLRRISDQGVLIVAAAGNQGVNNDGNVKIYPASYPVDGIISVAATTHDDSLSDFSNYGRIEVDLAAPGSKIISTSPGGTNPSPDSTYMTISGTSMATPIVSGAAALLLSQDPNLNNLQLKYKLMASVDKVPALADKVLSAGRLNLYKALTFKDSTPPPARGPRRPDRDRASSPQKQSVGGIRIFDKRTEKQKW